MFRRKSKRSQRITQLLFTCILVPIVLSLSFLWVLKQDIDTDLHHESLALQHDIIGQLDQIQTLFAATEETVKVHTFDPSMINKTLAAITKEEYPCLYSSYVSWADPTGEIRISGKQGILRGKDRPNIRNRAYFKTATSHPHVAHMIPPTKSKFSSKAVLPLCYGVADDDKILRGFFVLGLNFDVLVNQIRLRMKFDEELTFFLKDAGFKILISATGYQDFPLSETEKSTLLTPYTFEKKLTVRGYISRLLPQVSVSAGLVLWLLFMILSSLGSMKRCGRNRRRFR